LVSDLPRKNCWTIAEHAGDASPDCMQHLLRKAVWDADQVRDDVRAMAVEYLGRDEAIPVVDETGDVKNGRHSVGVQRQCTGTAGRIENAQVAVSVSYATTAGHTLIDREVYLPASWTDDPDRLAAAGVPEGTAFATKPQLAAGMLARAPDAGVPAGWVAGDEVYGNDPALRARLEARGVGYVLAVACDHPVATAAGKQRADVPVARLPRRAWQRLSAGVPRATGSTTGRGSASGPHLDVLVSVDHPGHARPSAAGRRHHHRPRRTLPRGSDPAVAQRNPTSPDPRHPAQPAIGRRC
jgi:SRSO17 transposase